MRSLVALMLMLSLPAAASAGASARSVIELTDATFDQQVATARVPGVVVASRVVLGAGHSSVNPRREVPNLCAVGGC
jgi:hypothetical protein